MSQIGYGAGDPIGYPFDFYVPLTAFTITMQTGILVLNPAGTLATGTVNLPLNPPDGCLAEISSTQTQTAITVAANTSDLIAGAAVTALVANTRVGYRYSLNGTKNSTGVVVNPRTWVRVA